MMRILRPGIMVASLLLLLLGGASGTVSGQSGDHPVDIPDKEKPSVYLKFEKKDKAFEDCSFKSQDVFTLSLRNNSGRPIRIEAVYPLGLYKPVLAQFGNKKYHTLPSSSKVRICYQPELVYKGEPANLVGIEKGGVAPKKDIPEIHPACTCKSREEKYQPNDFPGLWILPGSYILFDVPQQYLAKDLKIFTLFNYEWEIDGDSVKDGEPIHRVYLSNLEIKDK